MQATPQETQARRYRIEKYLTEGGMGAIYIGKKLGPGGFAKEVVLKQLLPEYTSRPEFRDLFFREAKISATLDHANIVHTFDLVESDQSLFIVMEYVRGADLRTIIRRARQRKRELSPAAAIHIALEILAGLSYAHARRDATGKSLDIIHRDVSPSNIICSVQGTAKLSDFGIAKASTYSSVFYRVRGKVGYMSPEQARSQSIDHRCDLYSLSVCLYESLSGERLFVGDLNTPADEIYGISILPVSQKRKGLPKLLDDVLARALAPNVDDRYQNAAELGEALRKVAHRSRLTFSAPELAAHLRDILGDDPERWLRDEPQSASTDPQVPAGASSDLVGTEASSIGIVNDIPQDEAPPSVLSPNGVGSTKDFDLDSMLDDEETRPGGEGRGISFPPSSSSASVGDGRVQQPPTPPPVWTRTSSPFPLATPKPIPTAPPPLLQRLGYSPSGQPAPPPAPLFPAGRSLPRATQKAPAIPPPFSAPARAPAPPPPPFPGGGLPHNEIEDATPPPPVNVAPTPLPQPRSFDIEDVLTPPPGRAFGGDSWPSPSSAPFRPLPPAPYPSPSADPEPLVLNQPQTIDFRDAVSALLPEKKGGPPGWLAMALILMAMVGGAALAHRATQADIAALTMRSAADGKTIGDLPMVPPSKRAPSVVDTSPSPPRAVPETAESPTGVPAPRARTPLDGEVEPLLEKPDPAPEVKAVASPPNPAAKPRASKVSAKRRVAKPVKPRGKR